MEPDPHFAAQTALTRWGGEAGSLEHLGDFTNSVYRFRRGGERLYLRFSPPDRCLEQIEAELELVQYLHAGGLSVSVPAASTRGALIEEGPDGAWRACAFTEAPGTRYVFDPAGDWQGHFRNVGRTMGSMHTLSKQFAPQSPSRRLRWDEEPLWVDAAAILPVGDPGHTERALLQKWLCTLPNSSGSFGLIHGDFGSTNYHVHGERITLFDFDDSGYHWFPYEIAVTVYPFGQRPVRRGILSALLDGYVETCSVEEWWWEAFTGFCRLRLLYMYLVYAKKWGFTDLSSDQEQWFAAKRAAMKDPVDWSS